METPTRIPNSTILRLIAKGYLSSQLAQELHISKAAVFKRIKHLVKLEYIHTEKKGIIKQISLTAKGLAELNSVGVTQDAQPSPQKPRCFLFRVVLFGIKSYKVSSANKKSST